MSHYHLPAEQLRRRADRPLDDLEAEAADLRAGWVNPPWARPGGSKPESWHFEFVGAG